MKISYIIPLLFTLVGQINGYVKLPSILTTLNEPMEYVKVFPYNYHWRIIFSNEAAILKRVFGKKRVVRIEHFGSTSIPGMSAKPVVDIIIGLNKFNLDDNELEMLLNLGYNFIEKSSYCQRFYFQKRGPLNINLSFTTYQSETWKDCLSVRDYLRTHPDSMQKYATVKNEAIAKGYLSIDKYSAYKQDFFKHLVKNARVWWGND